jgi:4-hydroxybenzoate polyprenyltransferase
MLSRFIKSRLLISTAAALLALASQVQFGSKPVLNPSIFLIFFGTNIYYNIHRIFYQFTANKNRNILFTLQAIFIIIGFLVCLRYCTFQESMLLVFVMLMASFYSFPYLKNTNSLFNLREVPYIKSLMVVFIWAIVTVLFPYLGENTKADKLVLYSIFIGCSCFIFALIIPFDIRDTEDDRNIGMLTIPIKFGAKKSMLLANGSLFIYLISSYFVGLKTGKYFLMASHSIVFIITYYVINTKRLIKDKIYYEVILDGMILLNGLIDLLFYYFVG